MDLSHTRVETYLDCPQRYRFRYVDRIHEEPRVELEFGKLVHRVLEFLHDPKNATPPGMDRLAERYEEGWAEIPEMDGLDQYKSLGLSMLKNYYAAHLPLKEDVLAVEQDFRLPLDAHVLVGVMDRVGRSKDGTIIVTDYKTSRTLPTQPDVDKNKQVIIYHHSAQQLYPRHQVVVRLHYLKFDFVFETAPAQGAWIEVKSEMLRAAYGIESGHFAPKPGSVCEYCGYTTLCPAMRHLFEAKKEKTELFEGIDINEAVREYVELKEDTKASKAKIAELSKVINSFLDVKGYTRLFVDDIVLSRVRSNRITWDTDAVAAVLDRLGLLKDTLGVSLTRLKELLESDDISSEHRRLIESCSDHRYVDTLRYRFNYEDGD